MTNYDLLIQKLDAFIRKFYVNQILRGSLYFIGLILALFLVFNLLEYQFYFGKGLRKFMFFSFIAIGSIAFYRLLLLPAFKYFRLGKQISHEHAANIIGSHFEDVKDKLINILQLKKQSDVLGQKSLILASIAQKSNEITLVSFKKAIDFNKNKKYLKYAIPPFLLLVVLLLAAPSIITESTTRIIQNGKDFEKDAPFQFVLKEDNYEVLQYEDFLVKLKVEGTKLPDDVFIDIDNYQYRLNKESNSEFSYLFKNVQKSQDFHVFSGKLRSVSKTLKVLPKPNLVDFNLTLDYPRYTLQKDETLSNIGDIIVPAGTKIKWSFTADNTDELRLKFSSAGSLLDAERKSNNIFQFDKRVYKNENYSIYVSNQYMPAGDSISYSINVVPDQYPSINVNSFTDSFEVEVLYFAGTASDDYGLTDLFFHYSIFDELGREIKAEQLSLGLFKGREIQYNHLFDIFALQLKPGQKVNYYFEIYDNDAVNGRKSSKTSMMTFAKPSLEEFKELEDSNEEDIKDNLKESLDELRKMQEELRKMREKLLQEKELDWQNKKELEEFLQRQKELEEKIKEAKEKFEENLKNQNEFSEPSPEIQEKQEQLKEMFEELLDEESQDLMEKIQELMEELNKENSIQMLEQFEMNDESMEKEMDRLMELFKQLELEKEINETIEDLNQLAEEQEKLSEETKEASEENKEQEAEKSDKESGEEQQKEQEELQNKQDDINEKFEDIKEKLDELEEKNEELEFPKELGDNNEEQMEDIQEDLDDSQQQLQQQQNSKAAKSQKNASQKMKSMAGNLQSQMMEGQMEQMAEDLKTLRQLLENIVTLSFDQEALVNQINRTNANTPKYVSLVQEQFKIKDDFKLVEDSLQALSKRVSQIETFVAEKVTEIQFNMSESIEKLEERQKPSASQFQRFTMKNLNDLALMLSESMENMQQQMASMMQGNQMCKKPGNNPQQGKNGQVPMDKITEGQKQMSDQLQKMMQQMKEGKGNSAKEYAQSAAKQAALRKALEELKKQQEEEGKGTNQALQDIIDQMDQNEIELVNKRLNNEMMNRQQDIVTRLLEAEKAERQREFDNKRKGETAREIQRKAPPSYEEFIKKKEAEIDIYKTISPSLRPYYKNLVQEYYNALKTGGTN